MSAANPPRPASRESAAAPLRVLIVDDEPLARERIRSLLALQDGIDVVGECANGLDAIEAIGSLEPELVFLDIQMPEVDGFGVLREVGPQRMPVVVFVTAYDQFALKAFDAHALDYLLKPFDVERFEVALQRARVAVGQRRQGEFDHRIRELLGTLEPRREYLERIVVRTGLRIAFLRADEVDWMEAEGNYVRLHVGKKTHLLRETMGGIEARLDPARFIRIHRSTIVNIDRIRELESLFQGEYVVILQDGTKLGSSRGYRERLRRLLEGSA